MIQNWYCQLINVKNLDFTCPLSQNNGIFILIEGQEIDFFSYNTERISSNIYVFG